MTNPSIPKRKTHRLVKDLYKLPGAYFITICTDRRQMSLAHFNDLKLILTPLGELTEKCWLAIPDHYSCIKLDWHVIMPNHIHGILFLTADEAKQPSVPNVINQYKSSVTRFARKQKLFGSDPIWQVGFWDHIVRNEDDLNRIREYIRDNPVKWHLDRENKDREGLHELYQHLVENSVAPTSDRYLPEV